MPHTANVYDGITITYRGSPTYWFSLPQIPLLRFLAQVGDFRVSRGPPTVPPEWILFNTLFFMSQNQRKEGPLCNTSCLNLFPLTVIVYLVTKNRRKRINCNFLESFSMQPPNNHLQLLSRLQDQKSRSWRANFLLAMLRDKLCRK